MAGTIASGTGVRLAYIEQAVAGTTPAITPTNFLTLRSTSRAINPTKNILESAEVRASRQKADVRHGFTSVVGTPGYELSLLAYDDFIRFAMGGAWVNVTRTATDNLGTAPGTIAGTSIFTREAGTGESWITDGFRKGDRVRTTGYGPAAYNDDWTVVAVTATDLTVADPLDTISTTEAFAAGPALVYPGQRMDIGSNLYLFTMERQFVDVGRFQAFRDCSVNEMSMSVQPEAIVGGAYSILGTTPLPVAANLAASLEPTGLLLVPPPTRSPFAAFDGTLIEGNGVNSVITSLDFSLNNNRTLEAVVGSKFSPCVFEGEAIVTGSVTPFFETEALLNKFINEEESTIALTLEETGTSQDFMQVVFPRVKYNGGEMDPPQNGPVPITMPFQSLEETAAVTGGTTVPTSLTIQKSTV